MDTVFEKKQDNQKKCFDSNTRAICCYEDFGRCRIRITGIQNPVPDGKDLFIRICEANSQSSNAIDGWPESADGYYRIPAYEIESERMGSALSFCCGSEVNDPLSMYGNTDLQLKVKFANSDVETTSGNIQMHSAPNHQKGQDFLRPSTARASRTQKAAPENSPRPQESAAQSAAPAPQAAASPLKTMSPVIKWLLVIILILLLAIAGWWLFRKFISGVQSGVSSMTAPPAAEQTVEDPKSEEPDAKSSEETAKPETTEDNTEAASEEAAAEDTATTDAAAEDTAADTAAAADSNQEATASEDETSFTPKDEAAAAEAAGSQETGKADSRAEACSLTSDNDSEVISNCMKTSPSDEVLADLVKESLANKRCEIAKRIMTSRGRSASQAMALMYAKLSDPNAQNMSDCIPKDSKSAVYWYEKALKHGDNAEAQNALEKLKNE